MDIQKEREAFESVFPCSVGTTLNEYGHYESKINQQDAMIQNISWVVWQAAKSQAVPEWKDYSQQSPRIDGRYQIFINGEQLAADWKSPFGFADPIEGVALIQDLITHWAVLSADPVIMEQSNEH